MPRVAVILQIEDAGEAWGREAVVLPQAVAPLSAEEIRDPPPHGVRASFAGSNQSQHCPRRLKAGADVRRVALIRIVAVVALAPAAVRILPGTQPFHRSA